MVTRQESVKPPEWLLVMGGVIGMVIASVAVQKMFPRKINYIHKDERKDSNAR